ncbi:MAG: hypothetical protein JST50_20670 [Bacteroidetes bacterium]|jgi:hypothetical protein|nr:hypothetical protein [Bacteroidota bacterium]
MKTVRTSIFAAVVLAMISFAACKKGSNKSSVVPSGSAKLSFQMQATNANLASLPADSVSSISGLVWTAGSANIGRFAFEARRQGVSINVESNNLTNVDLFALTPLQTYITLDTGVYKEIEITAFLESTDTIPPLKVSGTFTNDSSKVVPIEFDLSGHATVQVEEKNIDINGTTDYTALLSMQLDKLTKGITADDLNKAKVTNGTIIISQSSNSALYWKMRSNIARCGWGEFREWRHDHN